MQNVSAFPTRLKTTNSDSQKIGTLYHGSHSIPTNPIATKTKVETQLMATLKRSSIGIQKTNTAGVNAQRNQHEFRPNANVASPA
ncbi:hypothetical protein KBY31_00490 [Ruegeria pomeroyi]|nr:hypothetical protein [Ruegeria pomeroyi]MCE8556477.1 hypothetical protein [Ruegeria pomeroyi]